MNLKRIYYQIENYLDLYGNHSAGLILDLKVFYGSVLTESKCIPLKQ